MQFLPNLSFSTVPRDLTAGLVVSLVALPLCLGVALASGAPLFSGLVAGIVGGILVGAISGSHTSVSGPAAGLTAIVAAQIAALGSFEAFLAAVAIAGLFQVILGFARAGSLARFFPSAVIKGLLVAIGIILILKQIPHVLGHDADPQGEMSFFQPDNQNTFTELAHTVSDLHPGAAVIGLLSILLLTVWNRVELLKKSVLPAPLVVVLFGVGMNLLLRELGNGWSIGASHLVNVPTAEDLRSFLGFLASPDFSRWRSPTLYTAAITIALVASLETLLNLEAVDKIDPKQRHSPASRELIAQGVGNLACGFLGGIPVTSVIVRSSVNIGAGVESKLSTIVHGALLLISIAFLPHWLNAIPLACLAAILLVTGFKLASPKLFRTMKSEGPYQFTPFLATVVAIVFTDLLSGVLVGLAVALAFILASNVRMPIRKIVETHLGREVVHIELADQVSFLNRAALSRELDRIPEGGQVLLDARTTDYIDPDVLDLIHDYKDRTAPARGVGLSLIGFHERYERLENRTEHVDYSSRSLQETLKPEQVLDILMEGHARFRAGRRITRDLARQSSPVTETQHPLAVVVSCVDSRAPVELIFDLGLGDIFSVRVAGNVAGPMVLGSVEYACAVAGARLVLVLGHTRCGAVTSAVELCSTGADPDQVKGCQNLGNIVRAIDQAIAPETLNGFQQMSPTHRQTLIDAVAKRNVLSVVESLSVGSEALRRLSDEHRILIVGAIYDVVDRGIEFLDAASRADVSDS
ncbi:MAG TPA: SulP family inorganic anion transporter [Thermomicrobiales bacterium]|nr:SulP family inorganic anion transporter [Thermomicrobiales bacterium]